jgi:hypothetical protein
MSFEERYQLNRLRLLTINEDTVDPATPRKVVSQNYMPSSFNTEVKVNDYSDSASRNSEEKLLLPDINKEKRIPTKKDSASSLRSSNWKRQKGAGTLELPGFSR